MTSWPKMQFCEVARVVTGNTPPRAEPENYGGAIPWVKPPDLDTPEPITRTSEFLTEQGAKKARLLPKGSVMVGCIGRVGIVGIAGTECATNQQINSLVFGPRVMPKFGYYACVYLAPVIKARAGQAVLPLLNKGDFEKLEMPVPDLREQARIVELLDQADALRRQRAEADAKLARLLPALFRHHFGDQSAATHVTRLGELVEEFRYGTSVKSGDTGVLTLRIPNVVRGRIDFSNLVRTDLKKNEQPRLNLEEGDVVFVRTNGNREYVGRCAYFAPSELPEEKKSESFAFASYLIRARLKRDRVDPRFLTIFLATDAGRNAVLQKASTSAGQYNINIEGLSSLSIPTPSIELQRRFCAQADNHKEIIAQAAGSAAKLETLFQTLLHRAFTGELTARWREAHLREGVQEMTRLSRA